jgi:hypothetical protein
MVITIFGWTISATTFAWNFFRTTEFRMPTDAGAGSDRVPPVVTTGDGTAYKDFRDPQGTWRDTSTGLPVTPQRQTDLTRDWNQAVDGMRTWDTQVPLNIPLGLPTNVDTQCNRDYTAARGWTLPRDPLVLDLDGDGIETVGINPLAPVLFDHDNDGVRTGTGWIKSDDGLLVLDRNGNGTIDGGAELFGDNTPGPAGTPAANGFIALQGQDGNSDGQINSQDASYIQLRVWRDLNQEGPSTSSGQGVSQAGVLQSLQHRQCVTTGQRYSRHSSRRKDRISKRTLVRCLEYSRSKRSNA